MEQRTSTPSRTSQDSMSRLTVRLPAQLHRAAKVRATVAGEPLATLVERALRRELEEVHRGT